MNIELGAVLRTLARLSEVEQPEQVPVDVGKAGLVWLADDPVGWETLVQAQVKDDRDWTPMSWRPSSAQEAVVDRLASLDALHREDRLLRVGWAFLCGPARIDGKRRKLCLPLVSRPVRLESHFGGRFTFRIAGDLELFPLFPLLDDWSVVAELEERLWLGQAREWIVDTLRVSGFAAARIVEPGHDPVQAMQGAELVLIPGAGLYAGQAEEKGCSQRGTSLHDWAVTPGIEQTAFAALYQPGADEAPADTGPLFVPLPLSLDQEAAVRCARTAPLTLIGGPPGSGKTHTLAALALDAVAAGRSVLLASRTRNAAEVLGAALRRAGGPTPVLFGDSELRQEIARELGDGLEAAGNGGDLGTLRRARDDAVTSVERIEEAVGAALHNEELATLAHSREALMATHRAVAPNAFTGAADLNLLGAVLHRATHPRTGLFGRWRAGRAGRIARRMAGAADDADLGAIEAALQAAEQSAAQVELATAGGTALGSLRAQLAELDTQARTAVAAWLRALVTSQHTTSQRRAVAALATALRSGKAARRQAIAEIASRELVKALPLWVGTLADVDDILPAVPGMFDLVVIDEASHVDQPLAAPALLRGDRAVVAGDPRQLRHVSFVRDAAVRDALVAEGTGPLADRLNVPKVSLFDAAAGVTGVRWLTEHHRSAPHLISFAATRFYDERIELLTTHPAIADLDCIDTEHVAGKRDKHGVNTAEIAAVLGYLRSRIAAGARSIGVISPFRAQIDALEEVLLKQLSLDEITAGGIRVGTVHGVQGGEFDEVVISLALTDEDHASTWRFANDRYLLAVLTTRARQHVHVITSARNPVGLIGEYLRHADIPPTETAGIAPADDWTGRLAAALTELGRTVRTGYPLGQWRIDLVAGERESAVAIETRPHPDGPDAHLARWRALTHAGWQIHDAYPTRFDHDPIRAAMDLANTLTPVSHPA